MLVNELLFNSQYRNGAPVSVNSAYATRPASSLMQYGGLLPNMNVTGGNQPGSTTSAPHPDAADYARGLADLAKKFDDFSRKPWNFPMRQFLQEFDNVNRVKNNSKG